MTGGTNMTVFFRPVVSTRPEFLKTRFSERRTALLRTDSALRRFLRAAKRRRASSQTESRRRASLRTALLRTESRRTESRRTESRRTESRRTESRRTASLLTGLPEALPRVAGLPEADLPEAPRRLAGVPETGLSETGFRAAALMSFFRNRSQLERSPGADPRDGAAPAKSLFQTGVSVFFSDEGADDFEEKTEEYSPLKDSDEEDDAEETVGRAEYDKLFDSLEDSDEDEDEDEEEDYENEDGEDPDK